MFHCLQKSIYGIFLPVPLLKPVKQLDYIQNNVVFYIKITTLQFKLLFQLICLMYSHQSRCQRLYREHKIHLPLYSQTVCMSVCLSGYIPGKLKQLQT